MYTATLISDVPLKAACLQREDQIADTDKEAGTDAMATQQSVSSGTQ